MLHTAPLPLPWQVTQSRGPCGGDVGENIYTKQTREAVARLVPPQPATTTTPATAASCSTPPPSTPQDKDSKARSLVSYDLYVLKEGQAGRHEPQYGEAAYVGLPPRPESVSVTSPSSHLPHPSPTQASLALSGILTW